MATLILYPKSKIESGFLSQLAKVTEPVYLPLRHLEARHLSVTDMSRLQAAQVLVISSWYALNVYTARLKTRTQPTDICVLSRKMAVSLQHRFPKDSHINVRYATEESQQGLDALCQAYPSTVSVLWLIGNLTKMKRNLGDNEATLVVYNNRWSDADQRQAETVIIGKHFDSVLVTSPSAYIRLKLLMEVAPGAFKGAKFYTLGKKTAATIQKDHLNVWLPETKNAVLARTMTQIISDHKQVGARLTNKLSNM